MYSLLLRYSNILKCIQKSELLLPVTGIKLCLRLEVRNWGVTDIHLLVFTNNGNSLTPFTVSGICLKKFESVPPRRTTENLTSINRESSASGFLLTTKPRLWISDSTYLWDLFIMYFCLKEQFVEVKRCMIWLSCSISTIWILRSMHKTDHALYWIEKNKTLS